MRIYAALAALVSGVWAASMIAALPAVVAGCAATTCLCMRRRPAVSFMGLVAAAASCGVLVGGPQHDPTALESMAPRIPQCEVTGRLLEHGGGLGSLVAADALVCDAFQPMNDAGILVIERPDAEVGAVIKLTGWLLPLSSSEPFDVARRRLGAQASMSSGEAEVVAPPAGLHSLAARIRGGLTDAVMGMESDRAALLAGLTTGETHGMAAHTEELVQRAGLSHLVAVSGSNVAIVVGVVALAVARLGLRARILVCAGALGLYVLVVGPEASVLRAATMGGVALLALGAGRRTEPLHALGLALIVVLALRPGLVFSVGLHLSAAATAGIVVFAGPLSRRMGGCPRPVALALAVTLAAQIAVAPVLVGVFGELSLVAPLANLLAAPVVAPATVLGLGAATTGAIWPAAGSLCARLAEPFVAWILGVGRTTGGWSWASLQLPEWWGWPLGALVAIAALATMRSIPAVTEKESVEAAK